MNSKNRTRIRNFAYDLDLSVHNKKKLYIQIPPYEFTKNTFTVSSKLKLQSLEKS